jgi:hypothetical protein
MSAKPVDTGLPPTAGEKAVSEYQLVVATEESSSEPLFWLRCRVQVSILPELIV